MQLPHVNVGRTAPLALALLAPLVAATASRAQCTEGCVAIHTLEGEAGGDQFGWVSNDLGDIDGDDVHDFVITAPTNDAGGGSAGRIYVYSGATADEIFRATGSAGWRLGHDAAGLDDVSGDGVPDVIAGAPFVGTGRIRIYSGTDGTVVRTIIGEAIGDQFGFRVWGHGDFDGDKCGDFVVGAPNHDRGTASNVGSAYVYSGKDFSLICNVEGDDTGDRLGSGVCFIGDVNGDERDDIAVGAMNAGSSNGGLAYVYSWNGEACERLYELDPGKVSQNFGQWFMNGGPDVDRDGTPDVYVNDFAVNRAHIFSGVDGTKIWELSGDGTGQFGIGRLIEDVDGDCFDDMILAAWIHSGGAASAGKAYIYSGRTGEILETFTHDVAGAGFGFDANGQGDMNDDGAADYLITAASDLGNRGRAYVIAGNFAAPAPGDLNGDEAVDTADLIILLAAWGECPPPPAACPADLDCNGVVDTADLITLLANWS